MRTPTVHLNGTSRDELDSQLGRARETLRLALDALHDATPNARDYYPQGEDAFREAAAEHAARVSAIRRVLADIGAMHEAVIDAPATRNPDP